MAKVSNRILALRTKLNLSQRKLAKKVGVSQQHIQRLETSDSELSLRLAIKLCEALNASLSEVFPRTKKTVDRLGESGQAAFDKLIWDKAVGKEMEKAGIDTDVVFRVIQLKFRGQEETIDVPLENPAVSQLWTALQGDIDDEMNPYVIFAGADKYRYALRRKHLLSWTIDVIPEAGGKPLVDRADDIGGVRVLFADGTPITELDGVEDHPDEFHDSGPLNYVFEMLEMGAEPDSYRLRDEMREAYWFRTEELALFAAHEDLIADRTDGEADDENDISNDDEDDEDEDENGEDISPSLPGSTTGKKR